MGDSAWITGSSWDILRNNWPPYLGNSALGVADAAWVTRPDMGNSAWITFAKNLGNYASRISQPRV